MSIRNLILVSVVTFFVSACGGGDSSSDSGGQGRPGCSNPDLNGSFSFRASNGESFTGRFSNNNTLNFDFDGGGNGTWAYVGNPPSQIRITLGSNIIDANITPDANCRVTTITLTAPDGVAFTGTR